MKANCYIIGALAFLLTFLIPFGIQVQLMWKDVPIVHYLSFGAGKILYLFGALPFLLLNTASIRALELNLYELPVVGGMLLMIAVSFVAWWFVLIICLGHGGEKIVRRNVRFK
jgi:hypothetical protein